MRRFFLMILAALTVFSMTACGGGKTAEGKQMDMQQLYTSLQEAVQMPEMLTLDERMMLDYCGIRVKK